MNAQRRRATGLLSLACLVILLCLGARMLSTSVSLPAPPFTAQSDSAGNDVYPSPCQLSLKSLLSASPEIASMALLALATVILLYTPLLMRLPRLYLRPPLAPPERRLHLCHCVFRE
ncbi:suppressor protein [Erwinia sp.]|uniref:suppressor protein n=1 Tax=Erwinia citreus TaxID=558 RepID=UPI003C75CCE3